MYSFLCARMGVHHPEPKNIDRNIIFVSKIMSGFVLLKSNTIYMQMQTFFFEIEDVFTK